MASEHACWPMAPVSKSTAGTWWQSTRYVVATLCLAAGSGISSTICDRLSLAPGSTPLRRTCPFCASGALAGFAGDLEWLLSKEL